jgi:hypothetical protein
MVPLVDPIASASASRQLLGRLLICVTVAMSIGRVNAQLATEPALKAAFLYNFAKFAEWPADILAPGQRLSLCVVGDKGVADALEQTINGHAIESHELTVAVVTADGPIRSCHLLYVVGLDVRQSTHLIEALKGAAVFTVSDGDKFAESGGVAQLIQESGRMRFAINVAAAQRARLQLSSKLLSLAKVVKDQNYVQP